MEEQQLIKRVTDRMTMRMIVLVENPGWSPPPPLSSTKTQSLISPAVKLSLIQRRQLLTVQPPP